MAGNVRSQSSNVAVQWPYVDADDADGSDVDGQPDGLSRAGDIDDDVVLAAREAQCACSRCARIARQQRVERDADNRHGRIAFVRDNLPASLPSRLGHGGCSCTAHDGCISKSTWRRRRQRRRVGPMLPIGICKVCEICS